MACRRRAVIWTNVNSNIRNKFQWNVNRNSYIFIKHNAFENVVCEMSILSRPRCVNGVADNAWSQASSWLLGVKIVWRVRTSCETCRKSCHDDVIEWKHFPRYWPLCGKFTGHRWISHTKASDAELWCFFFYLRPNERLSKQSWGWWLETLSSPLWRHRNVWNDGYYPVPPYAHCLTENI